jgi:hypothetical protein
MIKTFDNANKMYFVDRPMEVRELPQGIILPWKKVKNGPRWGLGGVCREDGSFEPLSAYDGGWATHGGIYEWQDEDRIDEDVVYFGTYFNHWGHFLIDMIGRIWYYAQGIGKGLKLAYIGEEEPIGNFLEFFSLLGVEQKDLLHVTKPTRFRKVIVPEFCCKSCEWYSNEYREIFNTMIRRVAEEHYEPEAFRDVRKVYFTRTSFSKAKATEFGEENIVTWLQANGFASISPEKLSVRDQIYIWNHAKEIACLDGSIPMSIAFSDNPALKLTVLHKTSLEHLNLELYLLMRPCDVTLLDVWHEPYKNYPKNIGGGPFLLHLGEDAKAYSRQRGWEFPFEEKALSEDRKVNQRRMLWSIIDIKGRIWRFLFAVTPQFVKNGVRRLRGHES